MWFWQAFLNDGLLNRPRTDALRSFGLGVIVVVEATSPFGIRWLTGVVASSDIQISLGRDFSRYVIQLHVRSLLWFAGRQKSFPAAKI